MTATPRNGFSPKRLSTVADVIFSNVDKLTQANEHPVMLCNYTDVYYNRQIRADLPFMRATATQAEIDRFRLKRGDVVITKDSETADDIAVPAYIAEEIPNLVCGYHLAILRPNPSQLDGRFLVQLLQQQTMRHYFFTLANGVTRFGLGVQAIREAVLQLPGIFEQNKIADILITWDMALENISALIAAKERRKKGLMLQLLLGQKRLPGFKMRWNKRRIGELLRSEDRYEKWDDSRKFKLAGVRRNAGGLFFRDELDGNQIKVKTCKKIRAGDFLISRRQITYGGMAMVPPEFDGFDVNDEYEVLVVREPNEFDMRFFNYFSQTARLKHAAYLASNGFFAERLRLNFDLPAFLGHKICVPPTLNEQRRIAEILDDATEEIRLLRCQRGALEKQKRGLMQRLLKGKIRIKV